MKKFSEILILFVIGGFLYYNIETLWRGYSHLSMFVLGGISFVLVGLINEFYTWEMPMWKQMSIATVIITVLELVFGLVLNVLLGLDIWDYSHLPFNLFGQICLGFSILWFFLSGVAILLDDYLRYWLFNKEEPRYRLF